LTDQSVPPKILPRLIVLALAIAVGQLWAKRHLGWGSETPWIAALLFVLAYSDKVLDKVLSKDGKTALESQFRRAAEPILVGRLPMLAGAAALMLALLYSSVTVLPGSDLPAGGKLGARLITLDGTMEGKGDLESKQPVRFSPLRTSPFGRQYRLTVDGYLEETVTVYPIIGLNVTPDRDLRRSPSVLFRPSVAGLEALASEGTFTLAWRPADGSLQSLLPPQGGQPGSFLVGRAQPVPSTALASWRLELAAASVQEPTLSRMIQTWTRYRHVAPTTALVPGMALVAEVRSRVDKPVERAEVVLGSDALIDVPLLAVVNGG
jgi:hypothetical protein